MPLTLMPTVFMALLPPGPSRVPEDASEMCDRDRVAERRLNGQHPLFLCGARIRGNHLLPRSQGLARITLAVSHAPKKTLTVRRSGAMNRMGAVPPGGKVKASSRRSATRRARSGRAGNGAGGALHRCAR